MRTIAIVNQKGGCGKTTTAINLAGVFAGMGYRTLLVDMDPLSHCAAGLAIPEQRIDVQIGDAMLAAGAAAPSTSGSSGASAQPRPGGAAEARDPGRRGRLTGRAEPEPPTQGPQRPG